MKTVTIPLEDYDRVMEHNWYNNTGYAMNDVVGMMHRFIMGVKDRKLLVDHIFHNTLDNRKSQLRVCTKKQNMCNRRPDSGSSSVYKGVTWDKRCGKWAAYIGQDGKKINLGLFTKECEAALAHDEAAKKYHNDFARLNFPEGPTSSNKETI